MRDQNLVPNGAGILFTASLGSDSGLAASKFLVCRRLSSFRLDLTPGSPLQSFLVCRCPSSFAGLGVVLGRTEVRCRTAQVSGESKFGAELRSFA